MRRTARKRWSLKPEDVNKLIPILLAALLLPSGCRNRLPQTTPHTPQTAGTSEMELLGPPPRREPTPEDLDINHPMDIKAVPRRQGKPAYPPAGLPTEQACIARVLYHVEPDGSATLVHLEWDVPPGDAFTKLFEASIRDAIAGWEFSPAHRIITTEFPDGSRDSEAIPIKYADRAVIRFRVLEGRGVVE